MDFFDKKSSEGHRKAAPSSAQQHSTDEDENPPSSGELMASGKILMDAATSKFSKAEGKAESGSEYDKAKLAAAADEVVEAAQHYGKTEGKSYGTYVEKAHGYLHNYGKSSPEKSTPTQTHKPPQSHTQPQSDSSESSEGMDYGKYLGKASEFFNK